MWVRIPPEAPNQGIKYQMKTKDKLVARIKRDLPMIPLEGLIDLVSYRGPKDAGQMSWEALGTLDRICSAESMSDLLKARKITTTRPNQYRSNGWEIGSG